MESKESFNQSITFRNSIIDKNDNLSKNETTLQNIENFIEDLQSSFNQEMENIYTYYVNIKEIIDNLVIEFPMIDISNFSDFLMICEELFKFFKNSEKIFILSTELNGENKKLRGKIDKLNGKKVLLKSHKDNLTKELNFKEYQIKKLEEDNLNLTKEITDLTSKLQKIKEYELNNNISSNDELNQSKNPNTNQNKNKNINDLNDLKIITEEKNDLILEKNTLLRKVAYYENEIKNKYINKSEFEKKYQMMESEINIYSFKLKNLEILCDKLQRELNITKAGKEDLRNELEKSHQKFLELLEKSSPNANLNTGNYNTEKPLNLILDDELFDVNLKEGNLRNTISKINKGNENFDIFDNNKSDEKDLISRNKANKKNDIIISNFNLDDPLDPNSVLKHKDFDSSGNFLKQTQIKTDLNFMSENEKDNYLTNLNDKININNLSDYSSRYMNRSSISSDQDTNNILKKKLTLNEIMDSDQNEKAAEDNKFKEVEFKNLLNRSNNNINKSNSILERVSNNETSKLIKTNKKILDNIISESLIKSQKRYSNIENLNSNFKFVSNKKMPAKPLKINDQEYYRNFFMLTFQAIKLNSDNPEIFENLKAEVLFKQSNERNIPYHKFHYFIKKIIKEYKEKHYCRIEYTKNKIQTVMNYLASKLY